MNKPNFDFAATGDATAPKATSRFSVDRIRAAVLTWPFIFYITTVLLLGSIYYAFLAAPLYDSEAIISIRSRDSSASTAGSLLSLVSGATSGLQETLSLSDALKAQGVANEVDKKTGIRKVYSRPRLDFINWLWPYAGDEDYLNFYNRMNKLVVDRDANAITIDAYSFTPQSAAAVAKAVVDYATAFTDRLSEQEISDSLKSSKQQLTDAWADVTKSRTALSNFRNTQGVVDPTATTTADIARLTTMEGAAATQRANLSSMLTYTRSDSPQAQQLRAQIADLDRQVASLQGSVASQQTKTEAYKVTLFEALEAQSEYDEKKLAAALAGYDTAVATAEEHSRFLFQVVRPTAPTKSTAPNRLLGLFVVMASACAVYAFFALIIAAIRDHQGI